MHISGSVRFLRAAAARTVHTGMVLRLTIEKKSADGSVTLSGRGIRITTSDLHDLPARGQITVRLLSLKPTVQLEILRNDTPGRDATGLPVSRSNPLSELYCRVMDTAGRSVDTNTMHQALVMYRRIYGEPRAGERRSVQRYRMRGIIELVDRDMMIKPSEDPAPLLQWLAGVPGRRDPSDDESRSEHGNEGDSRNAGLHDLGEYLRRATAEPDSFLQLYNALAPAGDLHWVVIPIRGTGGSPAVEVEGVLKVAWHRKRRKPVQALLSVSTGQGANWWFNWVIRETNGSREAVLRDSGSDGTDRDQQVDQNLLAGLGFPGHTEAVERQVESDGFTLRSGKDSVYPEVDTYG